MVEATTPAQYAEAPPMTHPAVVDRLVEHMQDVTLLLSTGEPVTFVEGREPREALDALRAVADHVARMADGMRPTIHATG